MLRQAGGIWRLAAEAEVPIRPYDVGGVSDRAEATVRAQLGIGEQLDPRRSGRRPVGDDENRGSYGRPEALGECQGRLGGGGARADPELELGRAQELAQRGRRAVSSDER